MDRSPLAFLRTAWAAPILIVLAGLAAYHNSFQGELVFDDLPEIRDNLSIRHLADLPAVLVPDGSTVAGRPVSNLSLALNYAVSGSGVWSYHALNLAIHIGAALALFGIVRRTLGQGTLRGRFGDAAEGLALAIAVLWMVHPVQTASVSYLSQRTEELMGLFYLLTLYGFIRAAGAQIPGQTARWAGFSVVACLLGMGSKEVMVTAPAAVFLYDRTFITGTFREAWSRRRRIHAALAATWIPFAALAVATGLAHRGVGYAGYAGDLGWGDYVLTEFRAVLVYLRLSLWPSPLIFDYGGVFVRTLAGAAPDIAAVCCLVAAALSALVKRPAAGFAACWFFLILGPSSSIVPVLGQVIAENRLYLPLAGVVCLVVAGAYCWAGRWALWAALGAAVILGCLTVERNEVYRTAVGILSDSVQKVPGNGRAHNNLGDALVRAGRPAEAILHFEAALALKANYPERVQVNLGDALMKTGRTAEAIVHFETALRLDPRFAQAHNDLGVALCESGRASDGVEQFREALRWDPNYAEARSNLEIMARREGRGAAKAP